MILEIGKITMKKNMEPASRITELQGRRRSCERVGEVREKEVAEEMFSGRIEPNKRQ